MFGYIGISFFYYLQPDFLKQPFQCKLSSGSFDIDVSGNLNQDDFVSIDDSQESGTDYKTHVKSV